MSLRLQIHRSLDEIAPAAWDALNPTHDPFVRWAWLDALERAGCTSPESGWRPSHLALYRGSTLVAAAPAYIRDDTDGDFSRDWGFAQAAERGGIAWYPKLAITVPFTPVTGPRLLTLPGEDAAALHTALVESARSFAQKSNLHTVQILFPSEAETASLERNLDPAHGLVRRIDFQYHWHNRGYASADDFLACFSSKRRNQARRERRAPSEQGITLRTIRGDELAHNRADYARLAHDLHLSTVEKLVWGRRWLNRAFYDLVFTHMPEPLELVVAERESRVIAGAFNVATQTRLLGRYWGCFEEHPFLHFNVCLYHSIDDCIARGLSTFEGGAGGEHKIARGFDPSETYSCHLFLDPRLARSIGGYLKTEAAEREAALSRWRAASPILRRGPTGPNVGRP